MPSRSSTFPPSAWFRRFAVDRGGNVAMIFGLSLLPVLVLTGMAIDYARATAERTRLQQAVDATALALSRAPKTTSQAQLQASGERFFAAIFSSKEAARPPITVKKDGERIAVNSELTMPTTLMQLVGQPTMTLHTAAGASFATRQIEIALVLDNTGSMGSAGKMPALKTAAADFLDRLARHQPAVGDIRVSLIPYATQVNVGAAQAGAPWLDMLYVDRAGWTGCVQDREQNFDVNADKGAAYPAVNCAYATSALMPLTDLAGTGALEALKRRVAGMTPSGNTNITIGLAWGLASLSPQGPLPGARPFSQRNVEKFVVLLTDGDNTQSRYATGKTALDERTRMACAATKDPAKKIRLFTIRVVEGDANLLRNCASSPRDYYEAADAAQIQPAFTAILDAIMDVRLTN